MEQHTQYASLPVSTYLVNPYTTRPSPSRLHLPFSQVASVGPDVKDCSKNFPRAILYAAGMQTLINGTIHLVAAGATDPALYPEWEPGYLRCASKRHFTYAPIIRPQKSILQLLKMSFLCEARATGSSGRHGECRDNYAEKEPKQEPN